MPLQPKAATKSPVKSVPRKLENTLKSSEVTEKFFDVASKLFSNEHTEVPKKSFAKCIKFF